MQKCVERGVLSRYVDLGDQARWLMKVRLAKAKTPKELQQEGDTGGTR
jgi:hypothetical protein